MAKIAFVPQNETHALNFAALAVDLEARGHQVCAIILDSLMHQDTARLFSNVPLVYPVGATEEPFYRQGRHEQINLVRRFRQQNRSLVADVDLLVIGNDGAIQRVLSKSVRKNRGRVALVIDGNLTPTRGLKKVLALQVQRVLIKCATWLSVEEFMPTEVGHSRLDSIYVMHPCIKQVLVSQGIGEEKIETVTLPRHEGYLDIARQKTPNVDDDQQPRRILYATTAFRWHNLERLARMQDLEIAYVVKLAKTWPERLFRFRIHPREKRTDYDKQYPPNISISEAGAPLADDLMWADILWTSKSSIVFEAEVARVPCFISTMYFPKPDDSDYLCHSRNVHFVSDFGQSLRADKSVAIDAGDTAFPNLLARLLARDLVDR